MSDSSEKQLVTKIQEIQEEHITITFDFPKTQGTPRTGVLILRKLRFGLIAIIGMSHDEAQAGDIVVELIHNRFCTRAQVWVEMQNGARRWVSSARFQNNIILLLIFCRVSTHRWEKQRQVSRIGDVWIPFSPISPNHFSRFFIPRVEALFWNSNRIMKVDNFGTRSTLIR